MIGITCLSHNAHIFTDELSEALNKQVSVLQELEKLVEPQTLQKNSTIKLLADLQDITEGVQRFVLVFYFVV